MLLRMSATFKYFCTAATAKLLVMRKQISFNCELAVTSLPVPAAQQGPTNVKVRVYQTLLLLF
jgi:hypothetical protein